MAYLSIHNRSDAATPLLLSSLLRNLLPRVAKRPRKSPKEILATQARRTEARAAVDRLLR